MRGVGSWSQCAPKREWRLTTNRCASTNRGPLPIISRHEAQAQTPDPRKQRRHGRRDAARKRGITTVALLGKGGGPTKGLADYEVIVDSRSTARVQEAHTLILHLLLEIVEARFKK